MPNVRISTYQLTNLPIYQFTNLPISLLLLIFAARDDREVAQRLAAGAEVLVPVRTAGHAAERAGAVLGAVGRARLDRRLVVLEVARLRPDVVAGAFQNHEHRLVAVLVRVGLRSGQLADVDV